MTGNAQPREVEVHFERVTELRRRGLLLFPIRHHSPACAWHLRRLILSVRPSSVLVEGPRDFTPLLPLLLHPRSVPPVAVYTTYVDRSHRVVRRPRGGRDTAPAAPPARFAGTYPLCDYSPELVALRTGSRVGARLRFIDLTFPEHIVARRATFVDELSPRGISLFEENRLRASGYTAELCRRLSCRDADELWDHLFESRIRNTDPETFVREVTTFTLLARLGCEAQILEADGTLAREGAMAAAILEEMEELDRRAEQATAGPIVVVCGGLHAGGIVQLVSDGCEAPQPLRVAAGDTLTVLTRYSFPQLDALNGYAAGMPAPFYYQRLWQLLEEEDLDPGTAVARDLLVEIARLSRERDLPYPLSAADSIAAVEQTRRLASLRRHFTPCRQDLLDGAISCFVKGQRDDAAVADLVREVFAGTAVGQVPPEAGLPPLIADFRRRCVRLRLDLSRSERRRRALDIYRKARHRELSRFFHSLRFLGSPFAVLVGGPDFRRGTDLDLMQEHWEVGWTPRAEAALIEASVYGATVEEAAVHKLREVVAGLEREGRGRSAAVPVELLVSACRMGLHRHLDSLLELIEHVALEDPSFPSLVAALDQLVLLWQSREPLEAHELDAVPRLARLCFRRACYLLPLIGVPTEEELTAILGGLASLREQLAVAENPFEPHLFFSAAGRLVDGDGGPGSEAHPAIAGGAAGILFGEGFLDEERLLRLSSGHLAAAIRPSSRGGAREGRTAFLRGLLITGREALWRVPRLLERLDGVLADWTETEFVASLPELRLAFATLTPREIDRVARLVEDLDGRQDSTDLVRRSLGEDGLDINARITALVVDALRLDGLEDLLR